jgi:hypothetical protein
MLKVTILGRLTWRGHCHRKVLQRTSLATACGTNETNAKA